MDSSAHVLTEGNSPSKLLAPKLGNSFNADTSGHQKQALPRKMIGVAFARACVQQPTCGSYPQGRRSDVDRSRQREKCFAHTSARRSTCPYRKSNPDVLVMQSSQERLGNDAANGLDRTRKRCILLSDKCVRASL